MDVITMQWVLTSLVAALGALVSGLFWRQLKRNDDDQSATIERVEAHLRNQDGLIANVTAKHQALELALVKKVNQEELEKLYDKFDLVQKEWRDDIKELRQGLMADLKSMMGK